MLVSAQQGLQVIFDFWSPSFAKEGNTTTGLGAACNSSNSSLMCYVPFLMQFQPVLRRFSFILQTETICECIGLCPNLSWFLSVHICVHTKGCLNAHSSKTCECHPEILAGSPSHKEAYTCVLTLQPAVWVMCKRDLSHPESLCQLSQSVM